MKKRIEWVKPTLVKLDASKTLGGIVPGFSENTIFVNPNDPTQVVNGTS
jgi:hypothetical protein